MHLKNVRYWLSFEPRMWLSRWRLEAGMPGSTGSSGNGVEVRMCPTLWGTVDNPVSRAKGE